MLSYLDPHEGGSSDRDPVLMFDHTARGTAGTQIKTLSNFIFSTSYGIGLGTTQPSLLER